MKLAGGDVDLHAAMDQTETACSDRGLNEARSRWKDRVLQVLPAHVTRETRNGSRQRLALLMGSPRPLADLGVTAWKGHLKVKHQKELLLAFADTLGRWIREQWGDAEAADGGETSGEEE